MMCVSMNVCPVYTGSFTVHQDILKIDGLRGFSPRLPDEHIQFDLLEVGSIFSVTINAVRWHILISLAKTREDQMLCCESHCSNKNKQQHLHVPQPIGTTPLTLRHTRAHTHSKHIQPTYTLEGVRACGEAVPGRHSRLRQSDTSAHPEVTCKGTTTIKGMGPISYGINLAIRNP